MTRYFGMILRLTPHGENQFDFMIFGKCFYGRFPKWIAGGFEFVHLSLGVWKSHTFFNKGIKRFVLKLRTKSNA